MKVCRKCWSKKLSKAKKAAGVARANGHLADNLVKARAAKAEKHKANGVDGANKALAKANGKSDRFLVRASDGDQKEFCSERQALKKAIQWKLDGFTVEIWRQCELEMVVRIRG